MRVQSLGCEGKKSQNTNRGRKWGKEDRRS